MVDRNLNELLGLRDSLLFDFQPLSKSSDIEEVRRNGFDHAVYVRYLGALVNGVSLALLKSLESSDCVEYIRPLSHNHNQITYFNCDKGISKRLCGNIEKDLNV